MSRCFFPLTLSFCMLILSGCESSRIYQVPKIEDDVAATHFAALGNERFRSDEPVEDWWQTLKDQQLNRFIADALTRNKDVDIARANLLAARSILREAGFDRFPVATASGTYQRSRSSEALAVGLQGDRNSDNYAVGFDASWELDLFDRVSASVQAAKAREQAALANVRDVHVIIAAEVARTYIELRGAQYRLNIAERNAQNQGETFAIIKQLADAGRSSELDLARAETQLELTRATMPALKAEVVANIHRLAVLTGQVPDALRNELGKVKSLPSIPITVDLGNAADLLRRRPDISRAERELAAAIADYNVAVAEQFPRVNISGALGFAATSLSDFGASAVSAAIGPQVSWSAFDMGRVRARIRRNDANTLTALATYEKTVLEALQELQTAVSDFSHEEARRNRLQRAVRASQEAAKLARTRYEAGLDNFIDVLSAEAARLQAEDAMALSEISAALDLIAVYKALGGGGWQNQMNKVNALRDDS